VRRIDWHGQLDDTRIADWLVAFLLVVLLTIALEPSWIRGMAVSLVLVWIPIAFVRARAWSKRRTPMPESRRRPVTYVKR
jgi:hypothetical protein